MDTIVRDRREHQHHHHDHTHGLAKRGLRLAFFLTAVILGVEVMGGVLANSLALLSDAGHVVTDLFALGLAWFAASQAEKPSNERKTFGYHRVGILAALLNAVTLILVSIWIVWEAVQRFQHPEAVRPLVMFGPALVGILINLYIGFGLRRESENLNVRAAMLHVFGDVGVSVGVIMVGLIILFSGWSIADPILSVAVALLITFGAWNILRETTNILLEAVPEHISVKNLVGDVKNIEGVKDVHDLHVWSISRGVTALSCHVMIDNLPPSASSSILQSITAMLSDRYSIGHTTIQFECNSHKDMCCEVDGLYCRLGQGEVSCCDHD